MLMEYGRSTYILLIVTTRSGKNTKMCRLSTVQQNDSVSVIVGRIIDRG